MNLTRTECPEHGPRNILGTRCRAWKSPYVFCDLELIDVEYVPRDQLTIAEDALRAIVSPDCMIRHDHPDGGGWIDTEAPARIAEGALERMALASREEGRSDG